MRRARWPGWSSEVEGEHEIDPAGVSLNRRGATTARYGAAGRLRNQSTVLRSPSSKSTGSMWGNKPRSRV